MRAEDAGGLDREFIETNVCNDPEKAWRTLEEIEHGGAGAHAGPGGPPPVDYSHGYEQGAPPGALEYQLDPEVSGGSGRSGRSGAEELSASLRAEVSPRSAAAAQRL